jgi:hypothetical protein
VRRILIEFQGESFAAIVAEPKNFLPRTMRQLPYPRVAHREDKQLSLAQALEFCRTIIIGALVQRLSSTHNAPFFTQLFALVKTKNTHLGVACTNVSFVRTQKEKLSPESLSSILASVDSGKFGGGNWRH